LLSSLRTQLNKLINDTKELVPVVFAVINTRLGKGRLKRISVLLDSGASSSVWIWTQLAEAFTLTHQDNTDKCPLTLKNLMREQQRDPSFLERGRTSASGISFRSFHGGRKVRQLLVENDKIIVPASLQRPVVEWYHTLLLCHPGETRMEATISQHLTWLGLRKTVHDICTKGDTCQHTKRTKNRYGKLPPKEAETIAWDTLCVNLIGPYNIKRKNAKKPLTLWAVTMIDPATGWFEIASINTPKRADVVANTVAICSICVYTRILCIMVLV
jgi:Integrase zinc binding domain